MPALMQTEVLMLKWMWNLLLASAIACAGAVQAESRVEAPSASQIDVAAYNRAIAAQGMEHHCPDAACDTLPEVLVGYAPIYPPQLLAKGKSGHATVVFTVDDDGHATEIHAESATFPEFGEAAVAAIERWRFRPATLQGAPVQMTMRVPFPFEVAEPAGPGESLATAVVIEASGTAEGIRAEHDWIREHLPGASVMRQRLLQGPRIYDQIEVELPSGERRVLYFDITSFFGSGLEDASQ